MEIYCKRAAFSNRNAALDLITSFHPNWDYIHWSLKSEKAVFKLDFTCFEVLIDYLLHRHYKPISQTSANRIGGFLNVYFPLLGLSSIVFSLV